MVFPEVVFVLSDLQSENSGLPVYEYTLQCKWLCNRKMSDDCYCSVEFWMRRVGRHVIYCMVLVFSSIFMVELK